jgi:glutamine amidotransferase-like uncharacterized protein
MRRSTGRLAKAAGDPIFERYRAAFSSGRPPRAAVFAGDGASHSWLWFADLLERVGINRVEFIDETVVMSAGLADFDVLLVGGGDTYAMAESMGPVGARELASFVESGGLYVGSCAGAYLVLSDVDLPPFTPFSLVEGGMLNVMTDPPQPLCLAHKYLAPYGNDWVFHPVYGEVKLAPAPSSAAFPCFGESGELGTVLFGGPVIEAEHAEQVAAEFSGLTGRAAYLWPRAKAEHLLLGRAAVVFARRGQGSVLASGPHLEHPLFPHSNALAAELMSRHWSMRLASGPGEGPLDGGISGIPGREKDAREAGRLLFDIKREISNARIVGFGLEKMPVTWRIGVKVWEPEKVRVFLESAWRRLPYLEDNPGLVADVEVLGGLATGYRKVTGMVKSLKIKVESGEDSLEEAVSLLTTLKELTARFLSLYFRSRAEGHMEKEETPILMEL